jgi:hypothetical protein
MVFSNSQWQVGGGYIGAPEWIAKACVQEIQGQKWLSGLQIIAQHSVITTLLANQVW